MWVKDKAIVCVYMCVRKVSLVHEWCPCVISKQADLTSGCSAVLACSDVCCAERLTGLYVSTHISHLWFILTLFGYWWGLQAAGSRLPLVPTTTPQILWAQYGALSLSRSLSLSFFKSRHKIDFYQLIQINDEVSCIFIDLFYFCISHCCCFFHHIASLSTE